MEKHFLAVRKRALIVLFFLVHLGIILQLLIQSSLGTASILIEQHPSHEEQIQVSEPDVVWLMSYPNSGTSYTLGNVEAMTKTSVGTNYGVADELKDAIQRYQGGPWVKQNLALPPTGSGLLTKTHCGHGNLQKPLSKLLNDTTTMTLRFEPDCQRGNMKRVGLIRYGDQHDNPQNQSPNVTRAIHLVRNPFANVVARMNHFAKMKQARQRQQKFRNTAVATSPQGYDTRQDFVWWCRNQDERWILPEGKNEDDVTKMYQSQFANLPCRSEWHKYITWHNQVLKVSQQESLATMRLYYESYETDFTKTNDEILAFLKLVPVYDPMPFSPGRNYYDFYTAEERTLAKQFVMRHATTECWDIIHHYFE